MSKAKPKPPAIEPGRWVAVRDDLDGFRRWRVRDVAGNPVANVTCDGNQAGPARLLAASPKLYAACAAAREALSGWGDVPLPEDVARKLVGAHMLLIEAMEEAEKGGGR